MPCTLLWLKLLYRGSVTRICYSLLNVLYPCARMPHDVLTCLFMFYIETTICVELWTCIAVFFMLCDESARSWNVGCIQISCHLLTKTQFLQEWKRHVSTGQTETAKTCRLSGQRCILHFLNCLLQAVIIYWHNFPSVNQKDNRH
jgi:hypothetical protein